MARTQIGSRIGVPANAGKNINGGDDVGAGFTNANAVTLDALRARLTAISNTAYSTARLDAMTENDMIYALRVHDANASIN